MIDDLLQALRKDPGDPLAWLALADALEESGQAGRAELTRLTCRLRALPPEASCSADVQRVQELLQSGVPPCVPGLVNSIGMKFVLIPAGTFLMGSPDSEEGRSANEGPVHEVEITKPFYLGVHPVTQEQYETVMGKNPSWFSSKGGGKDKVRGLDTRAFPVEQVSWDEAHTFLQQLAARKEAKEKGWKYHLPTEAEWEYSCRGGLPSQPFHFGNTLSTRQANFGNTIGRTCEVGSYPANAFGLFDMHGNVWQWCADWYDGKFYASSPKRDPAGPSPRVGRVIRGGGWHGGGPHCRSARRGGFGPAGRGFHLGFRVALVPSGQ